MSDMDKSIFDSLGKQPKRKMSDNEIMAYYYKYVNAEDKGKYIEEKDSWFGKCEIDGEEVWFEHSGSDVLFCMRPAVEEHIKKYGKKD
jgi:hypothetical protein